MQRKRRPRRRAPSVLSGVLHSLSALYKASGRVASPCQDPDIGALCASSWQFLSALKSCDTPDRTLRGRLIAQQRIQQYQETRQRALVFLKQDRGRSGPSPRHHARMREQVSDRGQPIRPASLDDSTCLHFNKHVSNILGIEQVRPGNNRQGLGRGLQQDCAHRQVRDFRRQTRRRRPRRTLALRPSYRPKKTAVPTACTDTVFSP